MRKIFVAVAVIFLLNLSTCIEVESAPANNFDSNPGEYEAKDYIQFSPWDFDTFKVGYVKNTNFVYEDRPNHKSGYGV